MARLERFSEFQSKHESWATMEQLTSWHYIIQERGPGLKDMEGRTLQVYVGRKDCSIREDDDGVGPSLPLRARIGNHRACVLSYNNEISLIYT